MQRQRDEKKQGRCKIHALLLGTNISGKGSSNCVGRLNMTGKTVHWEMPEWAADTIMETLAMDARSSMLDLELQQEIKTAYNNVTWRCQKVRLVKENQEDLVSDLKGIIDGTKEGFFSADDLRQSVIRFQAEEKRIEKEYN